MGVYWRINVYMYYRAERCAWRERHAWAAAHSFATCAASKRISSGMAGTGLILACGLRAGCGRVAGGLRSNCGHVAGRVEERVAGRSRAGGGARFARYDQMRRCADATNPMTVWLRARACTILYTSRTSAPLVAASAASSARATRALRQRTGVAGLPGCRQPQGSRSYQPGSHRGIKSCSDASDFRSARDAMRQD